MLRLLAPLFGFAVFAALFAGVYYQPDEVPRGVGIPPKYRLGPEEAKPDFIEPAAFGENITVRITVVSGGPVDIYITDFDNISANVLNGTLYAFQLPPEAPFFNASLSRTNITHSYNFTFVADGETRTAVLFVSRMAAPDDYENLTGDEQAAYVTEINVQMRYIDRETKSLIWGYVLAAPSVALILLALMLKLRQRRGGPGAESAPAPAYWWPRDKGL